MKYTLEEKKIIRKYLKNELEIVKLFELNETLSSVAELHRKMYPEVKAIMPEDEEWEDFKQRSLTLLKHIASYLETKYKEIV